MDTESLVALTNERWGFESNCFVCERRNPGGLRIPFFHDPAGDRVVAEFTLDDTFSGAPSYAHGGVVLSVLDEAMAWAAIAVGGSWAVTTETTTQFHRPVRIGRTYEVHARVVADDGEHLRCEAEIVDDRGVRASARATFTALGPAQAVDAIGTDVSADDASFVRDRPGD